MRRVHREELRDEPQLALIGLRFDFLIEAPKTMLGERREMHLKIVSSQLKMKPERSIIYWNRSCDGFNFETEMPCSQNCEKCENSIRARPFAAAHLGAIGYESGI